MTDQAMIERVARALCKSQGNDPEEHTPSGRMWALYLPEARAAIEAMREPTPGMVSAGGAAAFGGADFEEVITGEAEDLTLVVARDAYAAMIDVALKEDRK